MRTHFNKLWDTVGDGHLISISWDENIRPIFQLLGVRISDCLGRRRRTLLVSTVLTLITTLICGFSTNSEMLIGSRLIQGCVIGINVSLVSAVLIDIFDIKERLKYQSLVSMALGLSFIIGPLLGSVLADNLSWRYIFWFTAILVVPAGICFYFLVDIPLKPEQTLSKGNLRSLVYRIDSVGCFLIASSVALFLVAMHLGSTSSTYTWSSPLVMGFFIGFGFLLFIFLIYERFITTHPLFPSPVVLDIHLILCYIQQFAIGWHYIITDILVFIQYESVYNLSPTEASLRIFPSSLLHIVATIVSGKISYRFENPKTVTIVGNILILLGGVLFIFVQTMESSVTIQIVIIAIYDIGMGLACVASTLYHQMILDKKAPELAATSISLSRCFGQCGSTMAIAFVFSLIQCQTTDSLKNLQNTEPDLFRDISASNSAYDYVNIKNVTSNSVMQALHTMYFENIRNIIYGFLAWGIIGLLTSIFVKIPPISKNSQDGDSINK